MQFSPTQACRVRAPSAGRQRMSAGVLALLLLSAAAAQGQTMYQWRDEKGRLHMSDKPPPGAASATVVTPRAPNVMKPAVEPSAAAGIATRMPPSAGAPGAPAEEASAASDPAEIAKRRPGETECQHRHRLYQASLACFVPFRNAAGAIAPEAAAKCGPPLAEPAPCS